MVSYWSLNNDSLDYWGNNNGTVSGATPNVAGKVGNAYSFDGTNDYINLSNMPAAINFTISVWIKPTGTFSKGCSGGDSCSMIYKQGSYYYALDSVGKPQLFDGSWKDATSALSLDNWSHLTIVRNLSNVAFYLNGAINNVVVSSANNISAGVGYIGIRPDIINSAYSFRGLIDEVLIFNRSLSASEVSQLYYGSAYGGDKMDASRTEVGDVWKLGARGGDYLGWGSEANSSELTINPDTTAPLINFTNPTPASGSSQSSTAIYVNVSSSDNQCLDPLCTSLGTCGFVNSTRGKQCDTGRCDGEGNCVECLSDEDCEVDIIGLCNSETKNSCNSEENKCEHKEVLPCALYFNDFENGVDGWDARGTNDLWVWGTPVYGPQEAHSGSYAASVNIPFSESRLSFSWCYTMDYDFCSNNNYFDPESCNSNPVCRWDQYCADMGYCSACYADCSNFNENECIQNNPICLPYYDMDNYIILTDENLYSPSINVSNINNATLNFWHYYLTEAYEGVIGYDGGILMISRDGGEWEYVPNLPYTYGLGCRNALIYASGERSDGYGGSVWSAFSGTSGNSWRRETLDLSPYLPAKNLSFRFRFTTDCSWNEIGGWFIDDFNITKSN